MNKDNILKVADAIEQHSIPDLGFNMGWWNEHVGGQNDMSGHDCDTCACIGGWTEAVLRSHDATESLGITPGDARSLFYPQVTHAWVATPAVAVAVLRHLAETGEVDWSVGAPVEAA